jgi:hypothetical protein
VPKGARRNGQNVPVEALSAPLVPPPPTDLGLRAGQARREARALALVETLQDLEGQGIDPDLYRGYKLALMAADRILGYKRGGLPMPGLGLRLSEATVEQRTIRVKWSDGRVVTPGLTIPSGPVQAVRMPALRADAEDAEDRDA